VSQQAGALDIFRAAREEGLRTLKEAAIEKVFRGMTTTAEMVRVTGK
jgi:type II secretory ATPase GspE/PulE/Tfp pilus assembly ATPase PilB-like protein